MNWKKILKWLSITIASLIVIVFICFLYFIPPFSLMAPESFIKPEADAPPSLNDITDQKELLLAERGKYIVSTTGCTGCHTPQGDQGPAWDKYLSGGIKLGSKSEGAFVSRNLTPDPGTGLERRTNEQVMRILRSGLNTEGRIIPHHLMPWAAFSHWTEEDRYAVVVYLRHLKPVRSKIPDPAFNAPLTDPNAEEEFHGGDFSIHDR